MVSKRHKPEEIVAKLRQVDVLTSQGSSVADAIRQIGVTEVIIIESWRRHYNAVRPHASLGYRPPAPEVFLPALAAWPAAQAGSASPATLPLTPRPALNEHSPWTTKWGPITARARFLEVSSYFRFCAVVSMPPAERIR